MANHDDDEFGAVAMPSAKQMTQLRTAIGQTKAQVPAAFARPKPAANAPVITVVAARPRAAITAGPTSIQAQRLARPGALALPQRISSPPPRLGRPATSAPKPMDAALILAPAQNRMESQIRVDSGGSGGPAYDAMAESESLPPDAPYDAADQSVDWTPPKSMATTTLAKMTTAPALATVKKSLWQRFLSLFGFGKKDSAVMAGEGSDFVSMAESVVRRARNGDQNAMALIALVRDNAKAGYPQAQAAFTVMERYVRANPVTAAMHGGEEVDECYADAVALSHGAPLSNPRIGALFAGFGAEEQLAIRHGMTHGARPGERNSFVRMGRILAEARRIQAVRQPDSSLSQFDSRVGWELGE